MYVSGHGRGQRPDGEQVPAARSAPLRRDESRYISIYLSISLSILYIYIYNNYYLRSGETRSLLVLLVLLLV